MKYFLLLFFLLPLIIKTAHTQEVTPSTSPPLTEAQILQILRETGKEFSEIQKLKDASQITPDDFRTRRSSLVKQMRNLNLTTVDLIHFISEEKAIEIAKNALPVKLTQPENPPVVSLKNGWLVVTFPIPYVRGIRGPDFIAQVTLHPLTGQVLIVIGG